MSDKSKQKRDLRKRRHAPGAPHRRRHRGPAPARGVPIQQYIVAQLIDDGGRQHPRRRQLAGGGPPLGGARQATTAAKVGTLVAQRAKDAGIGTVVFDRGGNRYHGRIAALADAAREAGLEF